MSPGFRTIAWPKLTGVAILLLLLAGCNSEEPATPAGTGAPPVTIKPIAPASPGPLEEIKKDLTTPTIIKPDQPSAPPAAPAKTQ